METKSEVRVKVSFDLEVDESGYPPCDVETLWCIPRAEGLYEVDNVPFFVHGVALGDIIWVDEHLNYLSVEHPSGNTTIRVYAEDEGLRTKVQEELRDRACVLELSHIPSLFALSVAAEAMNDVLPLLESYTGEGFGVEVAN